MTNFQMMAMLGHAWAAFAIVHGGVQGWIMAGAGFVAAFLFAWRDS